MRILLICSVVSAICILIQSQYVMVRNDNLLNNGDLATNVAFNPYSPTGLKKVILNSLPGWDINYIQQGVGMYYNSKWSTKLVVHLDANNRNVYLSQLINLYRGIYQFSINYAANEGWAGSSGMSVYWNGVKMLTIMSKQQTIQNLRLQLPTEGGQNALQIRGQGTEDSHGMTIADLKLKFLRPKMVVIPTLINNNLLNSRIFYVPKPGGGNYLSLSNWQSTNIQRQLGYMFNRNWGRAPVISLDSLKNEILRQSLNLKPEYYVFQMDYAAPMDYVGKSGLSLLWNGQVVQNVKSLDQNIHRFSMPLIGKNGQNLIQFRVDPSFGNSAMTLSGLQLISTNLPISNPIVGPSIIMADNNVSLIPSSIFGTQTTNYIPYWQSRGFSQSVGNIFNPLWEDKTVLVYDPQINGYLRKKVQLENGQYKFQVDSAPKGGSQNLTKMLVYINGQQVALIQPNNENIVNSAISFQVESPGQFLIQLRGDPKNIGDSLSLFNPLLTPLVGPAEVVLPNTPSPYAYQQPFIANTPVNPFTMANPTANGNPLIQYNQGAVVANPTLPYMLPQFNPYLYPNPYLYQGNPYLMANPSSFYNPYGVYYGTQPKATPMIQQTGQGQAGISLSPQIANPTTNPAQANQTTNSPDSSSKASPTPNDNGLVVVKIPNAGQPISEVYQMVNNQKVPLQNPPSVVLGTQPNSVNPIFAISTVSLPSAANRRLFQNKII